eukprot:191249_1
MAEQSIPVKVDAAAVKRESDRNNTNPAESALPVHSQPRITIVYWDHDNIPIPNGHTVEHIVQIVKQHISDKLGLHPIHFRLYTSSNVLSSEEQESLFDNGIKHIHINTNHTHVSKCVLRLSTDVALKLFELQQNKESKCNIALMASNDDYSYLLSRIHKQTPIASLLYVTLDKINACFTNNVDFVIQCAHALNTNPRKRQRDCKDILSPPKRQRVIEKSNDICITFRPLGSISQHGRRHDHDIEIQMSPNTKIQTVQSQLQSILMKEEIVHDYDADEYIPIPIFQFNGHPLVATQPIDWYYIQDGDVILWHMSIQMKLRHKKASEHTMKIDITTSTDVSTIISKFKGNVNNRTVSMYPCVGKKNTQLELFYNTGIELKLLNNNQTLLAQLGSITNNDFLEWDYGVVDLTCEDEIPQKVNEIVHPTRKRKHVKKKKTISIIFKPLGCESTSQHDITMEFTTKKQIKNVRKQLRSILKKQCLVNCSGNIPKPSLKFNDNEGLADKKKIGYYNICDGDVIYWHMSIPIRFRHRQSSEDTMKKIRNRIETTASVSSILRTFKTNLDDHAFSMYPDLAQQNIELELFYNIGTELKLLNKSQTLLEQLDILVHNAYLEWDYVDKYQPLNDSCNGANTNSLIDVGRAEKIVHHSEIVTAIMPSLESGSDRDLASD